VKPVLLIAYSYPPILTVGKNRTLRFERHLRAFGYEPIIHTVKNPDRVRTKTSDDASPDGPNVYRSYAINLGWLAAIVAWVGDKVARVFGVDLQRDPLRRLLFFPDVHIGWVPHCVIRSLQIIRRHRVEAIYVTCSPFSAVITGLILKALTGLPLVFDFRDPWSFNDHNVDSAYLRWMIRKLERRAIAGSDALIANTATSARVYRDLYPEYATRITHIYNGITAPPWVEPVPASCFTLLYVGALYNAEYLDLLFEAVNAVFAAREIRIEFAGFDSPLLESAISRHGVRERVVRHGFIQVPEELQRIYRRASALLYYNGFTTSGTLITSVVRAKLYDYIATGIPILAIAPPGEVSELLTRYSPASVNVSGDLRSGGLRSGLALALDDLYGRWCRSELTTQPNGEFLKMFGGEELTRQLASVFDRLTGRSPHNALVRDHPANEVP
jgi:glycosyltransferase involved in cell wall biosynthesis